MPESIFWFRRDLRLNDNTGLFHALSGPNPVRCIFIFDRQILDKLENKTDRRVAFIHQCLQNLHTELLKFGSGLEVYYGNPTEVWLQLTIQNKPADVYANRDYEPYARSRDAAIENLLAEVGIPFYTFKDHVVFEPGESLKENGLPYTVYTPYSKNRLRLLTPEHLRAFPSEKLLNNTIKKTETKPVPALSEIGFGFPEGFVFPPATVADSLMQGYAENRDFPGRPYSSKVGLHLRFGTVSIRQLESQAIPQSLVFQRELIWREFFYTILWYFPHVQSQSFRPEFDNIKWRNNPDEFKCWCEGTTGYPLVDAGMRELNETGFMHNRVRMVTASFLCKHLLIDWRWGEAYFAERLLDFDLAANNGNWQWAAGTGCDAAPWFRVFNPYLQAAKFDPDGTYIRRWVPELNSFNYPLPIVDHEFARNRALEAYGVLKQL